MKYRVPLSYNAIDPNGLQEVLHQYAGRHHNELIADFEQKIAELVRVKYAVALNSGTAAIHLGLLALGVEKGDEVLVSTFTYVASVNPILYLGATPVFIDSEPVTWNMDPDLLEQAIISSLDRGRKPKAIIVVHAYGMPAQMDRILAVAQRYGIPVLEDAAEALGAMYHGKPVGGLADVGILSFNTNKIMTTFGGGALLTNDRDIYVKTVLLAAQAREDEPFYHHEKVGFSYQMGPVNAAMGLSQLDRLDTKVQRRRWAFEQYRSTLEGYGARFQEELPGMAGNRWLSTVVWDGEGASPLRASLSCFEKEGTEVRLLWNPMHRQPVFRNAGSFLAGISEDLFNRGLCLPSGEGLDELAIRSVIKTVTHDRKIVSNT